MFFAMTVGFEDNVFPTQVTLLFSSSFSEV